MALLKSTKYQGLDIDMYIKICDYQCIESGSDESGKLYNIKISIVNYTSKTKEYSIGGETKFLQGLREQNLNLKDIYSGLRGLDEYKDTKDI